MTLILLILLFIVVTWFLRMRVINKEKNDMSRLNELKLLKQSDETGVEVQQINRRLVAYKIARFRAVALLVILGLILAGLVVMIQLHKSGIV